MPFLFARRCNEFLGGNGQFVILQEPLTEITDDNRLQLLLIAFALGAFFEGPCGFGISLTVCGTILITLGFHPLQAAGLSLLSNTAPVAFGAIGVPVIALNGVTNLGLPPQMPSSYFRSASAFLFGSSGLSQGSSHD